MSDLEIVVFTKDGLLSKNISLVDGKPKSDGSACVMIRGVAKRRRFTRSDPFAELADLIGSLSSEEAIGLGRLRDEQLTNPAVVTAPKLREMRRQGDDTSNTIARTQDHIIYRAGQPAWVLIDFDAKGMPGSVEARLAELGGPESAIRQMLPANCGVVVRKSTSAGLFNKDTRHEYEGSGGLHIYVLITDGADANRFLQVLHRRCWLNGLGWGMIGASGSFLERSIVDRMVGSPERLVFEGKPELDDQLGQHDRLAVPTPGTMIESRAACLDLSAVETANLNKWLEDERRRLHPEMQQTEAAYTENDAKRIADRQGCTIDQARVIAGSKCRGTLLPGVVLPFDDDELAGRTVGHVLADPDRFVGSTLSDPLEGPDYGRGKAMILRARSGAILI